MLLHLDTDIGGDPDDLAALAMVAGLPDVELTAVTTVVDPGGVRAGYARHCLDLLRLPEVPVVAGAETTLTDGSRLEPMPELWPAGIAVRPAPTGAATDALAGSIGRGATVVTIGPLTNLALLERRRPGVLAAATVVVMGGWVRAPGEGLPSYGPDRDWNVACDLEAAHTALLAAGDLTLVTLADTLRTHLRVAHLRRLRRAGPVGALLAEQAEAYARLRDHPRLASAYEGLPDDLLVFLHDPLACAVAAGWPGVRTTERPMRVEASQGGLVLRPDRAGRAVRLVEKVDPDLVVEQWLCAVEASATGEH